MNFKCAEKCMLFFAIYMYLWLAVFLFKKLWFK
jgi:hypothetical protein